MIYKSVITIILIILTNCNVFSQNLRIDHVTTVVNNLDSAVVGYEKQGFTVKPGRLHENGLFNAHIKFSNGSSFEIMSLQGEAKDKVAKNYEDLLKKGEGGVYLVLTGITTNKCIKKLNALGLDHEVIRGELWDYVIVPDLPQIFFIDYHIGLKEDKKYCKHDNKAEKILQVVIEGDNKLIDLLKTFGMKIKKQTENLRFTKFKTKTGNITIVQEKQNKKRPIIRSISITTEDNTMTYHLLLYY